MGRIVAIALWAGGLLWAHAPVINLTSKYLNFTANPGGPSPPSQPVTLTNVTHGRMPWSAAASTTRGGNWLSVAPAAGVLPGAVPFEWANVGIAVNSTSLAPGVYYGRVTLAAPGDSQSAPADNSPQIIEVALTVGSGGTAAPGIGVSPNSVVLEGVIGSGRPAIATLAISNIGGGTLNWAASVETSGGGNWLSATPVSGSALTVSAQVGSLGSGAFTGRVMVSSAGAANSPVPVPVTFRVRDPATPMLRVSANSLSFSAAVGSGSPPPQRLEITNGGEVGFSWRLETVTFNGGTWLAASPASGQAPGAVTVAVDSRGLTAGIYVGRLTIVADGATGSPGQIGVQLTVERPRPAIDSRNVVNAATFLTGFLAPGQIVTLFGSRLGPREGAAFRIDPETGRLPELLGGTRVTFDGFPAPLFFSSDSQVNLQVPFELAGRSTTRMVVSVEGLDPAELLLPLREAAPGVFTLDGSRAAALNQDSTVNHPDNSAAPGSVVSMFLTGQGVLDPPIETGALAPVEPPFPAPVLPVKVTMNGLEARVWFAGAAPGFAGLTQLNVEVPPSLRPSGPVNVSVLVGTHPAGKPVTLAVRVGR